MPRVRCPKCENTTRVPDDFAGIRFPCSECGHKIRVTENMVTPGGGKGPGKKMKMRSSQTLDEQFGWIVAAGIAVFSVVIAITSFFSAVASDVLVAVALLSMLSGLVWGVVLAKRDGAHIGYDWMDSSALRTLLMVAGPYWLGYVVFLAFTHIQYGLRRPMKYLPSFSLLFIGPMLFSVGAFASVWRYQASVRRMEEERNNPQAKRNNDERPDAKRTNDPAVDKAILDLRSADKAVRDAASKSLADMQPNNQQAVVIAALRQDVQGRQGDEAAAFYGPILTWANRDQAQLVVMVLKNGDKTTRIKALKKLGELKDPLTVRNIMDKYAEDETIRPQARAALKAMGSAGEDGVIVILLSSRSYDAVAVLKEIGTEKSIEPLQRELKTANNFMYAEDIRQAIKSIESRAKS